MTEEYDRYKRAQAAQWLEYVRGLGKRIDGMSEQIEDKRQRAVGLASPAFDGMPKAHGSSPDAVPNAVILVDELIDDYLTAMSEYVSEQRIASNAIARIESADEVLALTLYYLCGRSWEQCCVRMDYSWDGMMKLRRRALLSAYDVMPPEWRAPAHQAV